MSDDYSQVCIFIRSLELSKIVSFDVFLDTYSEDQRIQSINSLMKTESMYLKNITMLLTEVFSLLDRKVTKHLRNYTVSKEDIAYLLYYFPTFYDLHLTLYHKLQEKLKISQNIGEILVEFLSQADLLECYRNYVERITRILSISKIIEKREGKKHNFMNNVELIIMSPIQKFPQLGMAVGDIYKHTDDAHGDKVNLLKATLLIKSITSQLDRQRRYDEYNDYKEIENTLLKLKLPFSSTQLFWQYSVEEIKISEKVTKTKYNLILCDQNLIMVPIDMPPSKLSKNVLLSYSLKQIDCQPCMISRLNDLDAGFRFLMGVKNPVFNYDHFKELKLLHKAVNGINRNYEIINDYEKLLKDFCSLSGINAYLNNLIFYYKDIDRGAIDNSLVELERQIKAKEKELNAQMSSVIILKSKPLVDKIIVFESTRQAKEWIINFNRTRLQSDLQENESWRYYSAGSKHLQIKNNELPLVFQPYHLKDNGIIALDSDIVTCQSVCVVVGQKVCHSLWICLANCWVIILHFDYKRWRVLETFQMEINHPISVTCDYLELDIRLERIIRSEIWIVSGSHIFIHSLTANENSVLQLQLDLPEEIRSLCHIGSRMIVVLKSNTILIYSKDVQNNWQQESEISLERFRKSNDEIKETIFGHNQVYLCYGTEIVVCTIKDDVIEPVNQFNLNTRILAICVALDGVWISFEKENAIVLYDKFLKNIINTILIPRQYLDDPLIGKVTSILTNEKFLWLGTEHGFIICISTVDSSYCTDSHIPMYLSSKVSTGPITQFISFQNIQSFKPLKCDRKISDNLLKHSTDDFSFVDGDYSLSVFKSDNREPEDIPEDETDALRDTSLQNVYKSWKNSTMTLILALGNGMPKCCDKNTPTDSSQSNDQTTIFTFLE